MRRMNISIHKNMGNVATFGLTSRLLKSYNANVAMLRYNVATFQKVEASTLRCSRKSLKATSRC